MTKLFQASVLGLKKIYDMPDSWSEAEYRAILEELEVDDVADMAGDDLLEILLMALQDLEPEQAADFVLANKLASKVTPGVRQNIAQDLLEGQRAWEEVADIRLHAKVFSAALLLYKAFPKSFPKPDLMQLTIQMQALKPEARKLLAEQPEAAFVTRVLADGMDENSILERLFDEQLVANSFPEAEGIIWLAQFSEQTDSSAILTVYSSAHWLHAMEDIDEFESNAYNDRDDDDDDEV